MVSYVPPPVTPITEFLDQNQMYALAKAHFNHIHLLYGFLDKEWVLQQISMRWAQPEHCTIPDHLLANLAAVGSLYGDASLHSRIPMLLESAKKALEATSLMQPPNVIDVQSWLLRCMYLRSTGHPHACHTATCIVMHLVEAIGLHEETSNTTLHPPTITVQGHQTAEIRRRTFWSARMINTWVSFEYGRSRVTLRGITTQLPTPRDGDYTLDYLNLYSLSCFLDPERSESQWEDFLRQLDEYESKHDAIEMSKGNLALCGYRRKLTELYEPPPLPTNPRRHPPRQPQPLLRNHQQHHPNRPERRRSRPALMPHRRAMVAHGQRPLPSHLRLPRNGPARIPLAHLRRARGAGRSRRALPHRIVERSAENGALARAAVEAEEGRRLRYSRADVEAICE